jgi:rRNA maturation protein Nop10
MKVILQEIEEQSGSVYKVIAETVPSIGGYTTLTFSTVWTGAKKPNDSHIKYRVHLTDEAKKRLKEIL